LSTTNLGAGLVRANLQRFVQAPFAQKVIQPIVKGQALQAVQKAAQTGVGKLEQVVALREKFTPTATPQQYLQSFGLGLGLAWTVLRRTPVSPGGPSISQITSSAKFLGGLVEKSGIFRREPGRSGGPDAPGFGQGLLDGKSFGFGEGQGGIISELAERERLDEEPARRGIIRSLDRQEIEAQLEGRGIIRNLPRQEIVAEARRRGIIRSLELQEVQPEGKGIIRRLLERGEKEFVHDLPLNPLEQELITELTEDPELQQDPIVAVEGAPIIQAPSVKAIAHGAPNRTVRFLMARDLLPILFTVPKRKRDRLEQLLGIQLPQ